MKFALVAAHPDDEILGAGVLLSALNHSLSVIYVTDGAPRGGDDARNAGCPTWQEYAALRERESVAGLAAAGADRAAVFRLNCPDQQAVFRIAENTADLIGIFDEVRPSVVLTHSYEGGHPDHDAVAASVHAVAGMARHRFNVFEFAGYHAGECGMECERFRGESGAVFERPLTDAQRRRKREALDCHASQTNVLRQFPLKNEPLRVAPEYDFGRPPHSGPLYYERFRWGVTPSEWRALSRGAFRRMDLSCVC